MKADLKSVLSTKTTKHIAAYTEVKDVAQLVTAINGCSWTLTVQIGLSVAPLVFFASKNPTIERFVLLDKCNYYMLISLN